MSSPVLYPPPSTPILPLNPDLDYCDGCRTEVDYVSETTESLYVCSDCAEAEGLSTCDSCELLTEYVQRTTGDDYICRDCVSVNGYRSCDDCEALACELRTTVAGYDV